jgi:predicted ATPase
MGQLRRALDDALHRRGQILLVTGEPGIGKTRLAQELAAVAGQRDMRVLWGRCPERKGSPPYWPWALAIRTLAESTAAEELRDLLGLGDRYISFIVPELSDRLRLRERPSLNDNESTRFRLFHAVGAFFQRASRQTPMLLMLEDLHWADQGSLHLLEFIAQEVADHGVLILATYRDNQIAQPLAQTLGELGRLAVRRIPLSGLTLDGTAVLMTTISGSQPTKEIVQAVHAKTDGNPFFVTEISRLHAPDALAVPDNVRAAITMRLNRLSDLSSRALVVASVIGREFEFRVIGAVLPDAPEEDLLGALDEGLRALLIEPLSLRGEDWYQFRHGLIRDVLYESLSPSRRARWHAAIARALEKLISDRVADRAAELVQHLACAEGLIGVATLAKYSRIAGEGMLAVHAFEGALPHFARAWRAQQALPFDSESAAILAGLGFAQAATAVRWHRQEGWVNLRRAIEYYLRAGEIGRAVAVATHPCITAEGATNVAEVIERILDVVPRGSTEQGWLLARLGAALYFETGDYRRAQATFGRALEVSETAHEPGSEVAHVGLCIGRSFRPALRRRLSRSRRARDLATGR